VLKKGGQKRKNVGERNSVPLRLTRALRLDQFKEEYQLLQIGREFIWTLQKTNLN
jgi:hypothetical protein